MGIREEIEKLRIYARPTAREGYVRDTVKLPDVLSVLDEWECVAEGPLTSLLATKISDLIDRNVRKGDRIAIYRRKKK